MNECISEIDKTGNSLLPSNAHHFSFCSYLDIRSGSSSVGTVLVPRHSAQHLAEAFDVHRLDVDSVVAVAPVAVAVVGSPHSWAFVGSALAVVAFALPIRFVAVDLSSVLHDL